MATLPSNLNAGKARLLMLQPDGGAVLRAALDGPYDTTVVLSVEEATRALRAAQTFDVIVADLVVPSTNGADFLRKVLSEHKGMLGVLISLYADYLKHRDKSGNDPFLLLMRPYQPNQLLDTIRRAARFAQLRQGVAGVMNDLKAAAK